MAFREGLGQGVGAGVGFGLVQKWKAVALALVAATVGQGAVRTVVGDNPRNLSLSDKFWSKTTYGLTEVTPESAADSIYDGTKATGESIYDNGGRFLDRIGERLNQDFGGSQTGQQPKQPEIQYPIYVDPRAPEHR